MVSSQYKKRSDYIVCNGHEAVLEVVAESDKCFVVAERVDEDANDPCMLKEYHGDIELRLR